MVKPTIKSNSERQDLLKVVSHCKPKIRNAILKNCENDLIHIICDCVYNVVKGNVPGLTQEKVNKLAPLKGSYQRKEKDSHSERWWISSIFTSPCCSLNSSSSKQNSVVIDLMRRVYLTQQEMLKFMKEKRPDSLSPNLRKYYEARQEMKKMVRKRWRA